MKKMSHNEFVAYMKANANRLYTEKGYTMAHYNRDADNVEVLDFDLGRFSVDFSGEQLKVINNFFTEESVNKRGNMRLEGHMLSDGGERRIANTLDIEMVVNGSYNGFGKSDRNQCVFEFCEGDIYLIFCETKADYMAELESYFKFYEVPNRVFVEGSFNLYRDHEFVGKAFSEQEVKRFLLNDVKEYPEGTNQITKDVKNGYNDSSMDVSWHFFDQLAGRLPYAEDNACVEVYFDGVLVDNVYTSMDKAEALVSSLVQNGYDGCHKDVRDDWERNGGSVSPSISFTVKDYPQKSIEQVLSSARERCIGEFAPNREQEYTF